MTLGFPDCPGKEPACQCRSPERCGFNPWIRKIPWRRKWQPTPVFLPRKFHGQRSLAGYDLYMGLQRVRHDWARTHSDLIKKNGPRQVSLQTTLEFFTDSLYTVTNLKFILLMRLFYYELHHDLVLLYNTIMGLENKFGKHHVTCVPNTPHRLCISDVQTG